MTDNQSVPMQTPWDCRWTRFDCRASRKGRDPYSAWVCVRDGRRRYVLDEECESCENWEAHDSMREA